MARKYLPTTEKSCVVNVCVVITQKESSNEKEASRSICHVFFFFLKKREEVKDKSPRSCFYCLVTLYNLVEFEATQIKDFIIIGSKYEFQLLNRIKLNPNRLMVRLLIIAITRKMFFNYQPRKLFFRRILQINNCLTTNDSDLC